MRSSPAIRVVFAAIVAANLSSATGAADQVKQAATAQAPTGNAETGKRLYMTQTCYYCHGTVGQGAVTGARLAPPTRNVAAFISYIRRPTGQMPAFTETMLSDQALIDIYAYLRSIPAAKAAKEIPLLNQLKPK